MKFFKLNALAAALGALCLPFSSTVLAQADQSYQVAHVNVMPAMVVSATRSAQPLTDVVADVSLIDREFIERSGCSSVVDVLARLPGIEFSRNGGPGTTTTLYVRGGETRFVPVFVDGIRIDSQSTAGASWESLPLEQIERIELVRGPASAVYGSDAISGVVQIFTRKGEGAATPSVGLGFGSYNTRQANAALSGQAGVFDYALGIAHETSDGFNAKKLSTANPDRDGYRSTSTHGRLGWNVLAGQRVEATWLWTDLNSQYDSSKTADDRNLHKLQALGFNWQSQWTNRYSTTASVSRSTDRYQTKPSVYLTQTEITNYLLNNEYRLGAHRFSAILERREDTLNNTSLDQPSRSRAQNAVGLGYGWSGQGHTIQANVRHDDDSEFGGKSTGALSYAYALTPALRASISGGTGFRAPTLYQRFSDYGIAGLRPETSRNIEAGLRYTAGATQLGLTVYRNRVDNLITYQFGPGPCRNGTGDWAGCYANIARAQYEGMTLSAATQWANVNWRASYDLQNPKDLDTGLLAPRRSRQHGTFAADTRIMDWTVGAEWRVSGYRYDNAANTKRLGGYGVVNLTANRSIAKNWTVFARLDNVADKDYELAQTYAIPGRTFFMGVRWSGR
jgi:vitamin B12 transporter